MIPGIDIQGIVEVSCGDDHVFLRSRDGLLYAYGSNGSGQICQPIGVPKSNTPLLIPVTGISRVSAGNTHTLWIQSGGLMGCGSSAFYQLGVSPQTIRTPTYLGFWGAGDVVAAGTFTFIIHKREKNVWFLGSISIATTGWYPIQIQKYQVKALALSPGSTYFITENDELYSFGSNLFGQLGLGDKSERSQPVKVTIDSISTPIQVCGGNRFVVIVMNNGDVYTAGGDGSGHGTEKTIPTRIEYLPKVKSCSISPRYSLLVGENGFVYGCGANVATILDPNILLASIVNYTLLNISNVNTVWSGTQNAFFRKMDGSVWILGSNTNGMHGLNSSDSSSLGVPTLQPYLTNIVDMCLNIFAHAVRSDGRVLVWDIILRIAWD